MPLKYDVAVIGTGTSAQTLAYICREAGKTIAMIDSLPFGGTCAMRGCQPKKYFVAASEVVAQASSMQRIGIKGTTGIDWQALVDSKRTFTSEVPTRTEKGFQKAGMDIFHARARFVDTNRLVAGDREIEARHIVIASGAKPRTLNIPGENLLTTSTDFMNLSSLPSEIIFVGGGYISFEFAHVANRAGAEVTILQRGDRVLKNFDSNLVDALVASSEESGIRIKTRSCVDGVEKRGGRLKAYCTEGPDDGFEGDMVVHGAGRVADLEDLALEQGDIKYSAAGIVVNMYMQSVSNPLVYAIGDAAVSPFNLATTADLEGEAAALNICYGNVRETNYRVVPSVVFTQPPLASVGMGEAEARTAAAKEIEIKFGDMTGWPSSKRIGQKHACYKVIIDKKDRSIIGAHILGYNAEEVINIFAIAMKFKLKVEDLKQVLWAYPTYISDIRYML